jgi:hypothetical protein
MVENKFNVFDDGTQNTNDYYFRFYPPSYYQHVSENNPFPFSGEQVKKNSNIICGDSRQSQIMDLIQE